MTPTKIKSDRYNISHPENILNVSKPRFSIIMTNNNDYPGACQTVTTCSCLSLA